MWFESPPKGRKTGKTTKGRKTARSNVRRGSKNSKGSLLYVRPSRKGKAAARPQGRRTTLVFLLLAILAGSIWLLISGTRLLAHTIYSENEQFQIRNIVVNNPGGYLKEVHIQEYAGVQPGDNIFSVDLSEMQRKLESVALVREVEVRRELPSTLVIQIAERTPIARLGLDSRGYHLSADVEGVVLGPSTRTPYLPGITGLRRTGLRPGNQIEDSLFRDALELLDMCHTAGFDQNIPIDFLDISHPEYLELRLKTGGRVFFSRQDKETKLLRLSEILFDAEKSGRRIEKVDLTVNKNFPVTYR